MFCDSISPGFLVHSQRLRHCTRAQRNAPLASEMCASERDLHIRVIAVSKTGQRNRRKKRRSREGGRRTDVDGPGRRFGSQRPFFLGEILAEKALFFFFSSLLLSSLSDAFPASPPAKIKKFREKSIPVKITGAKIQKILPRFFSGRDRSNFHPFKPPLPMK